jgi:broad specificity phosphatase PhoE
MSSTTARSCSDVDELVLVRHAHAGSNRDGTASCAVPGLGLTPEGVEQARSVGELLATEHIALGVSSELARTRETLAGALGDRAVPRLVVAELNEIDFGSFDGGPLASYRAWAAAHPATEPAPGGGESRASAAARFSRGLRLVVSRPESCVLLVGHALFVRYVLDGAAGLVPAPVMTPVDHATPYRLDVHEVEAAATLLETWSRDPRFRDPSLEGRAEQP